MKSFLLSLFIGALLLFLPDKGWAQNDDTPLQTLCFGSNAERYCVDCSVNAGVGLTDSTYHWEITSPGFLGVIYDDPAFPGTDSTNHILIDWGNTPVGSYVLTVTETNANGCLGEPIEMTIEIKQISATNTSEPVTCNGLTDGSAVITAGGGTPGYNVSWTGPTSDDPAGTEISLTGGTYTLSNLGVGTYNVTVTDLNGCTDTTNVIVSQPNPFTAAISAGEPLCFSPASPGAAEFTITGGAGTAGATVQITYQIGTQTPVADTVVLDGSGNALYTVPNATADVTVTLVSITVGACTNLISSSDIVDVRDPIITSPISHD
jgi:hypothetical protein